MLLWLVSRKLGLFCKTDIRAGVNEAERYVLLKAEADNMTSWRKETRYQYCGAATTWSGGVC
jgi:hypothetical protein